MKKLLLIVFTIFTICAKSQITYTNEDVCQITFKVSLNNQLIDTVEYYFELHNDKLDIHFINTQSSKCNWFLNYNEEYKFVFGYKNSKRSTIIVNTSKNTNKKLYTVNIDYEEYPLRKTIQN